jgi:hypothetical protein
MLTLVACCFELATEMAGDDDTVDFSLAEPRKGTAKFFLPRAPLDAVLHQDDEDDGAHLLDLAVGSGMAGIGGTRRTPAS